jgi:hypothetical protein
MNALALSGLIFVLTLGGILLGALLRRILPIHHLDKDSQDVVRLATGLVATMVALVLGLLIAAAKGTYDTQSGQIKQITANLILLDNLLAEYGQSAIPIRKELRSLIGPFADRLWHEKSATTAAPFAIMAAAEKTNFAIQALSPQNEVQKSLQARAIQVTTDLAQTRLLLFTEADNAVPRPFIAILAFWLIIIFASFSLFTTMNATTFTCLSLSALSASCAMFLILELSEPFTGLLMISSTPLRNALGPIIP